MKHARREFIYLGWLGQDNFGDDLLHATWRAALKRPLDIVAPLHRKQYLRKPGRFVRERLRTARSQRLVLLGGGTTIGFDSWAYHLRVAIRAYGAAGAIVPGAGAAESTDAHALGLQRVNWPAWRRLSQLALLGVRGPLTAQECERNFRQTTVVGDPALLYPQVAGIVRAQQSTTLGVCVGSDPTSRFDPETLAAALDRFAAERGLTSITVFQLSPGDRASSESLIKLLRTPTRRAEYSGDIDATVRAIAQCAVFVSERLHGAVASVSLGIPTVPLAYASKCDDFWTSVTGERCPVTVGHSEDDLMGALHDCVSPATVDLVATRVQQLQSRLDDVAGLLSDWLAGRVATLDLFQPRPRS